MSYIVRHAHCKWDERGQLTNSVLHGDPPHHKRVCSRASQKNPVIFAAEINALDNHILSSNTVFQWYFNISDYVGEQILPVSNSTFVKEGIFSAELM